MTQRRKSKKTEAEPRRVNRRTFLAGAGAAACVGAGLWLRRKKFSKRDKTKAEKQPVENPALPAGEWRAVWVSYLEWTAMDFSSADAFRAGCVQMLENCAGLGLNTVLAQVRPFGDALYKSQLFPWSHLCTGVQGQDPGFDPLDILLQEAHGRGLSVEAWLNPYRLRSSAAMPPNLAENNLANTHPEWVCAVGDGLYLNPAEPAAADYVVQGVAELLQNYAVDGIHFDDYFYPTTDAGFDSASYQAYKNKGGSLSLAAWRRQNVNDLVKQVYAAVKQADGEVLFGISPQGNMDNNYNKQFIDVKKWLSEEGYLDYICPQVYFGFKNSTCPYEQTVEEWNDLIQNKVQLVVGLSPYKVGLEDAYAGNGRWEWANSGDILARMVETARKEEHYQGFALFRYNSVFQPESSVRPAILEELDSLQEVL